MFSISDGNRTPIEIVPSIGIEPRFFSQCYQLGRSIGRQQQHQSSVQPGAVYLICLLVAVTQFDVLIDQKMQLTGCEYRNDVGNKIRVIQKFLLEWFQCSFPVL